MPIKYYLSAKESQSYIVKCGSSKECTYHRYSIAVQNSRDWKNSVVGHVGQDIDHCDDRHGDGNGQWQVPVLHKFAHQGAREGVDMVSVPSIGHKYKM